ncbi:DNA repair protein [Achromobacter xylosoxidans]
MRGQLARAQGQAEKLSQQQSAVLESAQSQIAASNAQLGKFKGAYDELLVLARTKESERAKLAGALAQRDEQVKSCVAKNREMYQAGKDILNAYERVSTGDMMAMRQPFARSARVKFEEQAQEYGDKLYDAQVPASAAMQAQTK